MDPRVFSVFATFLKDNSGLIVGPDKAYLLDSRLGPISEAHGCHNITELALKLQNAPTLALKTDIIEAMTTNETSFFRDNTPFETFKKHVLPELMEKRKIQRSLRILCAASSSGQEPYSLALTLAEAKIAAEGWKTEILGIDLDAKILKKAEQGIYSQFEVQRGLPVTMMMKYFTPNTDKTWALKPEIRSMVKFKQRNLLHPVSDLGTFDVIFCRNVLIYFDAPTKTKVLERLAAQMSPDGFLFLGGSETVLDLTNKLAAAPSQRGVYRLAKPGTVANTGAGTGARLAA